MNSHLTAIGAILRKDVQLLWPIALAAVVLMISYPALKDTEFLGAFEWLQPLLALISSGACAFAVAAAIQADGPASTQHDWLTRPLPKRSLFAAKAIFVVAISLLPSMIGEVLVGIRDDRPWGEIVATATVIPESAIATIVALCVLAALTTSILEIAIVGILTLGLAQFTMPGIYRLSGLGEEIYMTGMAWLGDRTRVLTVLIVGGVILWMMYAYRRTQASRILFGSTVVLLVISPALLPWAPLFELHKRWSADPRAAEGVVVSRDGTCFNAILVNPPAPATPDGPEPALPFGGEAEPLAPVRWSVAQRRRAGAEAIGFETRAALSGAPSDSRIHVARVEAAYVGPDGERVHPLRPARFTAAWHRVDVSTQLIGHFWLLPRAVFDELASRDVRLQLDYSLSLLTPSASAQIAVDGRRRPVEGFGYCGAEFDSASNSIRIDCFKRGTQPAQLTANLVGGSADMQVASDYPDYTPSAFELLGGKRHVMVLREVPRHQAGKVTLTSYEPSAHFTRTVTIDGLLGADANACPAPRPESSGVRS